MNMILIDCYLLERRRQYANRETVRSQLGNPCGGIIRLECNPGASLFARNP